MTTRENTEGCKAGSYLLFPQGLEKMSYSVHDSLEAGIHSLAKKTKVRDF